MFKGLFVANHHRHHHHHQILDVKSKKKKYESVESFVGVVANFDYDGYLCFCGDCVLCRRMLNGVPTDM